ncbi:hypothetical protein [Veronia pacifica]|uniref:Uncharacterized protein n=1 Tax=Veronia pacifica TaxID=1080227 RepID=A0A1C3ER39_9GAMM|nr:hypothetical protein [Veronia pacifica]ODA35669.1 hypothetical protein A8L45_03380 [Veronia pacifica]
MADNKSIGSPPSSTADASHTNHNDKHVEQKKSDEVLENIPMNSRGNASVSQQGETTDSQQRAIKQSENSNNEQTRATEKKSRAKQARKNQRKSQLLDKELQLAGSSNIAISQFLTQLSAARADNAPKKNESIKDIMSKVESSFFTAQQKADAAQMMNSTQATQSKADIVATNQLIHSMSNLINDIKQLYPMNAVIRHPKLGEIKVKVDNPSGDAWELEIQAESDESLLRLASMKKKLEEGLSDETNSGVNISLVGTTA